jgi:hypothetical protein
MRHGWKRAAIGGLALTCLAVACDDAENRGADAAAGADARLDASADRPADGTAAGTDGGAGGGTDSPADIPAEASPDAPPDLAGDATASETGPAGPLRAKVDILFVVDNSGSMAEEQANLARNFPLFMEALGTTDDPAGPDLHIAVVSSDLGAGAGTFSTSCTVGGDQGLFCRGQAPAPHTGDSCTRCGVDTSQGRFLRTRNPNFAGSISTVFSCMARLGTFGCGFEHTLGALISALTTAQNGPFLRDDAYLAFVLITDEDDCTAAADSALFASPLPGQEASLRCALEGHICDGRHLDGSIDVNLSLAQCQTASDGALRPIGALVSQVQAVKGDPTRIIAAGIFGWPLPGNLASARYLISGGGAPGSERGQRPVCQSGNGSATVGYRVRSFIQSFPNQTILSICQDDFRPALEEIAQRIRATASP